MLKTVEEIEKWLDLHGVDNYTIFKKELTVDVLGSVDLSFGRLKSIPVQFGKVGGDFDCSYNQLTSLAGAPKEVGGDFYCYVNSLTSLEGSPEQIGRDFRSPPIIELATIAEVDDDGDFCVKAEDFNAKIQELKEIREEKALLESSVAKLCDTPQIGASPEANPTDSTARLTIAPKRKIKI